MAKIYSIPDNFIDGGKLFGGVVKTRNFIEALIMGGAGGIISFAISASSLQTRISLFIFLAAPGFLLGLFGVHDEPFSTFVRSAYKWYKSRKIMLFNGNAKGRSDDIVDRMLEQKSPQEMLAQGLSSIKEKRAYETPDLTEGIDFIFEDDEELTKYTSDTEAKKKIRLGKRTEDASSTDA